MTASLFILAAERSGDDLGAGLIRDLKRLNPSLKIHGIGGSRMAEQGVSSDFDISPLSILGFTEGLKAYPTILRLVKDATQRIQRSGAQTVVLIDSWGFTMRVAQRLRKAGFRGQLIKYVAPQVFAMREGRARILAQSYDHVMSIHSFDAPYFEQHGLPVTYVGNPVFDTNYRAGNGPALRRRLGISATDPVLALLFGSRPSEIARLADPFAATVDQLRRDIPNLKIISPVSDSVKDQVSEVAKNDPRLALVTLLSETDKLDIFAASNAALACSGTASSQLAAAGVPTVVAYKLSGLTYFIAKRLFKPDYISIVNIAADELLMPEFIQGDVTAEVLSGPLKDYLTDPAEARAASKALIAQTDKMIGSDEPASLRAAKTVLGLIDPASE